MDPLPAREISDGAGFYGSKFEKDTYSASRITLYDLPRHPIISICDFRNLVFGWYEDAPPRPIGASWPNATLSDLKTTYIRSHDPMGHKTGKGNYNNGAGCDTSFYYNNTLFDSYFFSGIPSQQRDADNDLREKTFPFGQELTQDYINQKQPLANTRLSYYNTPAIETLRDPLNEINKTKANGFEKTAAHLLIEAPFNVNSTSPEAWQSILSGFRDQNISGVNETYNSVVNYSGKGSPFVDNFVPSSNEKNLFQGYRRLNDTELATISKELTTEIRYRGVALDLGAFVNRNPVETDDAQQMSRLDKAVKEAGLNINQQIAKSTSTENEVSSRPDIGATAKIFAKNLTQDTGTGLPGYLKQQDILRPLAPIMATRGDTFIIRSYGETIGPITGEVAGKAWCEAVIQRVPEYVNATLEPWEKPPVGSENDEPARRLKVIKFRWLSDDDVS